MALTITVVKRFKPQSGVRRGLVDITFDANGPSWTVAKTNFNLPGGLWDIRFPAHVSGFVVAFKAATLAIEGKKVSGNGSLVNTGAADLDTLVVRAEYIGY